MNRFLLFLFLTGVFFTTGCATHSRQSAKNLPPQKMDMLAIGRGLSNGAVDVYDPSMAPLTMPSPPNGSNIYGSTESINKNTAIPVKDPSVTIYDIDAPQPAPVPILKLQPPAAVSKNYPSPFDPGKMNP